MITTLGGRPQTAEQLAHTILQQRILHGVMRPGERVDLDDIASELAVSRTPVRTALRQLESEGLVTIHPHRAVVVSGLSADDLEQVYAVRVHLECLAARESVPRLLETDLGDLRRIHAAMCEAHADADPVTFAEQDRLFHLALYRGARNPFFCHVIDDLRKFTLRFLTTYASVKRLPLSVAEHAEIIAAAEARDGELVEKLIRRNLERTGHVIVEIVRLKESHSDN